jgi:hypothetical protein
MKSRAARTTLGIVVGGALVAGGAVFASTASAGEHAAAPAAAKVLTSPAAPKSPQQLAHDAAVRAVAGQRALSAKQAKAAGETPVAAPLLAPAAAPKPAAAAAPKLADDPTDTTAPTGSYKMSLASVWIGQLLTLTELGVSDDVSAPENIARTVDWGDGTTSELGSDSAPIGKRYNTAGKYKVSVTLTDEAGNSGPATVANATVTTTKPGKFKIAPTKVFNNQRFTLAISSVPAGTTKINVAWGDGYGSTLAGKNQTVGKRYYLRSNGAVVKPGTMTLTARLTNKNGSTSAFVIGKVTNKRDGSRPVIKFTKPKSPKKRSSWKSIKGTAKDTGSGIVGGRIGVAIYRTNASYGAVKCLTAKKTWVSPKPGICGFLVKVTKGKWSVSVKGLIKGHLIVAAYTEDYSRNATKDTSFDQRLTS